MTLTLVDAYECLNCCHEGCGIQFAVPTSWYTNRKNDHIIWYCPNGHGQHFTGLSDKERLEKEVIRERARRDQAEADAEWQSKQRQIAENSARAFRGVVTRTKNRVSKGICPCCNRYFAQLHNHMKAKHPDYGPRE